MQYVGFGLDSSVVNNMYNAMSPHGTTKIGTLTLTCFYCTVNLTEMIVDTQYIFTIRSSRNSLNTAYNC